MRVLNFLKCRQLMLLAALITTAPWMVRSASASNKDADENLNAAQRQSIIERVAEVISEHYVDEIKALEMAAHITDALNSGRYDDVKNVPEFCGRITHDLREICNDRHLEVVPYQDELRGKEDADFEDVFKQRLPIWKKNNFGFKTVELMDGNIGYIDLRFFCDARYAAPTAIAALNLVAYCDALIIDLRANSGGQPSMEQLICSYLFDAPIYIGGFYLREEDSIQQFWTQAYVSGPRLTDVPVYILVSNHTFSAAEGFAYSLQQLQRAKIIGETTAGGAQPQRPYYFPDESITVHVPYGRAVTPPRNDNWEGRGVAPDIPVPTNEALEVARIEALEGMLGEEEDENAKHALRMLMEEAEARRKPIRLTESQLREYVGEYERGIEIGIEGEGLAVLGYVLAPMGRDKFMVTNGDEQVQFERSKESRIVGFVVVFRDGREVRFGRKAD
jgi:hypothetical protein